MADGFGNFSGAPGAADPMADFLARERELLGDAAADFGNPLAAGSAAASAGGVPPELAAFPPADDVFGGAASGAAAPVIPTGTGGSDLFAAPAPAAATTGTDLFGAPAAAMSAYDGMRPQSAAAAGVIPLPGSPGTPMSGATSAMMPEADSEHILKWKEQFAQTIAERDAAEQRAKADNAAKAKADIDKFYEEYNKKREKALVESKALQERMIADLNDAHTGTFWERVVKQVEVVGAAASAEGGDKKDKKKDAAKMASNAAPKKAGQPAGNQKDVTRFKQVLLHLKNDKGAPGA